MELVAFEVDGGEFGVGDLDALWVVASPRPAAAPDLRSTRNSDRALKAGVVGEAAARRCLTGWALDRRVVREGD